MMIQTVYGEQYATVCFAVMILIFIRVNMQRDKIRPELFRHNTEVKLMAVA